MWNSIIKQWGMECRWDARRRHMFRDPQRSVAYLESFSNDTAELCQEDGWGWRSVEYMHQRN